VAPVPPASRQPLAGYRCDESRGDARRRTGALAVDDENAALAAQERPRQRRTSQPLPDDHEFRHGALRRSGLRFEVGSARERAVARAAREVVNARCVERFPDGRHALRFATARANDGARHSAHVSA
jgi:hypothetical protein